jgi:hypothetical protein
MSSHENYFKTLPREILIDTLYDTGIDELLSMCSTDKRIQYICNDDEFSLKNFSFPAGQKIGTIFCPKGGLAVEKICYYKLPTFK